MKSSLATITCMSRHAKLEIVTPKSNQIRSSVACPSKKHRLFLVGKTVQVLALIHHAKMDIR
jgi:hypothetical protein